MVLGLLAACAHDIDTTRTPAARGTLGEETFSVVCDRLGAQALPEDLTGASFHDVCHRASDGTYKNTVDVSQLPAATDGAVDTNGKPVTVATQETARAHAVARIEAMARRRSDLIAALDATFPDTTVPVHDINNSDPTKSCNTPANAADAKRRLHDELSDLLGRMTKLYDDGTMPQTTEALGRLMNAFASSTDAQGALAHFDARRGYRPPTDALGAIRPVMAYPNLRDFANTALRILSADSNPYDPNPKYDSNGNRIPVPGSANAQLNNMLAASHEELRTSTADPTPALLSTTTDMAGRTVLSRPRQDLELMAQLFFQQDAAYGSGASQYIVRRDPRAYALVPQVNGKLPAPFVDKDGDGLADIDSSGHFVTTSSSAVVPSPFLTFDATDDVSDGGMSTNTGSRDSLGRVLLSSGSADTLYGYLDTTHTFAASMMNDMKGLVNPDPTAKHETLMDALAGVDVLLGSRDGTAKTTKTYAPDPARGTANVTLSYDAYHVDDSALIDLVYAIGQVMADPSADATLAYASSLVTNDLSDVARLTGAGLDTKAIADQHPEASLPAASTLWDDLLDVFTGMAQEPGLMEDVLRALADPKSLEIAPAYANYAQFNDQVHYDHSNLNGPTYNDTTQDNSPPKTPLDRTKPATGANRSELYRFIELIHDTNNVTACNKAGAIVHAKDVGGTSLSVDLCAGSVPICSLDHTGFDECAIFKIDNLAKFYLQSMVGKATLYYRPDVIRNGVNVAGFSFGASTVDIIEASSGIGLGSNDTYGFWDAPDSETFRPRPAFLDRLVFFDTVNDSPNSGDTNYTTNHFLNDLQGQHFGTQVCPERVIPDPVPTAPDASPDGMVHGLRQCNDGDWLQQRDANSIFVWESFDFYNAMTPLLLAYTSHNREDLFLALIEALYKHWGDKNTTASECELTSTTNCTKDGVVDYEPILIGALGTDLIPALSSLANNLQTIKVPVCTTSDANGNCTASTDTDGISVMANAFRAMIDPTRSAANHLTDRHGVVTATRNDGTTNAQITPMYLLIDALKSMDASFTTYASAHPNDADATGRLAQWRSARSQLVDTFMTVNGRGMGATFADPTVPKALPLLVDLLRSQVLAHCPTVSTSTDASAVCDWARTTMTQNVSNVVGGPLLSTSMDLVTAIRQDANARAQLETLMVYLLNAASANDALPALLGSTNDLLQTFGDDANMVPLEHLMAEAVSKSVTDANGIVTQKSLVDASMALLARLTGRATNAAGVEICANETDPDQIITIALVNMVTPQKTATGGTKETPLETIMSVIADVNRAAPADTGDLASGDFVTIGDEVNDFLTNKTQGLEQFYEIVRLGTASN